MENSPAETSVRPDHTQAVFSEVEPKNERINRGSDDLISAAAWTGGTEQYLHALCTVDFSLIGLFPSGTHIQILFYKVLTDHSKNE